MSNDRVGKGLRDLKRAGRRVPKTLLSKIIWEEFNKVRLVSETENDTGVTYTHFVVCSMASRTERRLLTLGTGTFGTGLSWSD